MPIDGDGVDPEFERYEYRIKVLEDKVANLRAGKDELERKCFETEQRGNKLVYDFGFESIDAAESAVEKNPELYDRATNEYNAKRLAAVESELKAQRELRTTDLEAIRRLEGELESSKQALERMKTPAVSPSSSSISIEEATRTRAELSDLQARYDLLLQERDRLANKYEHEYGIFKNYKNWLERFVRNHSRHDPEAVKLLLKNMLKKLKFDVPGVTSPTQHELSSDDEVPISPPTPKKAPRTPNKTRIRAFPAISPLSTNIVNTHSPSTPSKTSRSPQSTPSKRKYDEALHPSSPVAEESQTQIDSQAPAVYLPHMSIHFTPKKRPRRHSDSAMALPSVDVVSPAPGPSTTPKKAKRPRYTEPVPYKARRQELENEVDDEPSQYEINPDANHGLNFQFDEVVRKKQHRHALGADDCEDCREYYEAVGPMPPRLQPPLWRSPSKSPTHHHHHHHHAPTSSIKAHKQEISRHRAQWRRAPTPPGYWDIGFPDTQEANKINARAAEMHREKREMVRLEAQKKGGKFRRKG